MPEQASPISAAAAYGSDEVQNKSSRSADAGAILVSWLFVMVGVYVMYVAFILYGSKPRTASALATLTHNGNLCYMPERELPIYLVGCTLTLVLSIAASNNWRRIAYRREKYDASFVIHANLVSLLLAMVGCAANLFWLLAIKAIGAAVGLPLAIKALALVMPPAAEIALFYVSQMPRAQSFISRLFQNPGAELSVFVQRYQDARLKVEAAEFQHRRIAQPLWRWVDAAAIFLIFFLLYIPRTDLLAGSDFQLESFHHWDFFAMAPAIGLLKGKLLATQVYCQYGIGWPLLLAKLDPVVRLSYDHTFKIAVMYGCVYFCGVYWLLRRLLTNPAWALAGLLLVLRLQMFDGGTTEMPLWSVPSASILRTPCDVWVFLLLLAHWRSEKPVWLLFAGAFVGLALLFVLDTGVYLTLTFFAYNLLWLINTQTLTRPSSRLPCICQSILALAIGTLVLICGLFAGSGLSLFSPGYARLWLEVLSIYPEGISMLPIAMFQAGLILSYWVIILYLGTITAKLQRFRAGNRSADEVIIGCIALLGVFYVVYYIGRSHPFNIFHLCIPVCIVLVTGIHRLVATFPVKGSESHPMAALYSSGAVVVVGIVVLSMNPLFQAYPNILWSYSHPTPRNVVCYDAEFQDICVTPQQRPDVAYFQLADAEMRRLTLDGKSIAVIANDDTSLYVASRSTLWNRYSPLLPPLMTISMLDDVNCELAARPVDYVFLLKEDPAFHSNHPVKHLPETTDCWARLAATTRRCYHFDHICGAYEVWRR